MVMNMDRIEIAMRDLKRAAIHEAGHICVARHYGACGASGALHRAVSPW